MVSEGTTMRTDTTSKCHTQSALLSSRVSPPRTDLAPLMKVAGRVGPSIFTAALLTSVLSGLAHLPIEKMSVTKAANTMMWDEISGFATNHTSHKRLISLTSSPTAPFVLMPFTTRTMPSGFSLRSSGGCKAAGMP